VYKFYEYSDEEQKEIDRLVEIAEGHETVVQRDKTVYENNNKDKPFSMEGFMERQGEPIATSPEIEKQRENVKNYESAKIKVVDNIGDEAYRMINEVNKRNKKMKITFLGISGALSAKYNSNMLIENGNDCMLFDCGEDVMHSLNAAGRKPEELDAVFISHLHFDHCGGLSWLAYYTYFISKKKIKLYAHESLIADIWSMLRPAMEKLDGKPMMTLDDYFEVHPIRSEKGGFLFGGGSFDLAKQLHVETSHGHMYSYGLRAFDGDKRFFISSDSKEIRIPSTSELTCREECDYKYVFCDCDVMNLGGVHPNYDTLKLFAKETKSKMWLYHYHELDDMPDAVADGFAGFVREGQIFEL